MGDHIVKIVAEVDGIFGSEIQDLCILDEPNCDPPYFDTCHGSFLKDEAFSFNVSGGDGHTADAIFPFASCKNAALFQRTRLGDGGGNLPQCTFQ
ncbi:MAG: hypothetical protein ACREOW_04505 [Thermodesulfobacteriota bacterium]